MCLSPVVPIFVTILRMLAVFSSVRKHFLSAYFVTDLMLDSGGTEINELQS